MNKDLKIQKIVISNNGTIDVQDIQDNDIHDPSVVGEDSEHQDKHIDKEEADGKSCGRCTALEPMAEESVEVTPPMDSYTSTVMVESDLPSVCPIEPIDQSTDSLPRLAMAPAPDCSQNAMQSDCEDFNQAWFTTKEDKDSLQGKGVKWRQGMWSKEESELLQNNIQQYCKSRGISDPHEVVFKKRKEERKTFYRTIAKGIHRPLFAIYRRVLRMYETGNYNGKYTNEEVAKLKELKRKHGNDWTAIGLALGRSASSVKDRCRLLNEKCSTGKWTPKEEDLLSEAVHELTSTVPGESVTTGILWTDVAKRVGTRSEKQCRSKWLNYLNWKECGGKEWNKTDEIDLIKKIYNLGVQSESEIDWFTLADGWSSARSPQWLRSKWWTIKKHVPPNLSFPDKVAYLHSHYARSLKHRLSRHDTRYLQLPHTEQPLPLTLTTTGSLLSPLTTCATVSTSVGHALTVDGEIYIARGDGKGSDGVNTYEMVHLRPLPNNDSSQPTSYIIEPVQVPSLILHQVSPEQGAKLTKITPSSGTLRQVILTQVDGNSQQSNTRENNIVQPAIVTSLPENGATVVLATEFLPKNVEDAAESISRNEASVQGEESHSFDEKEDTDIVQDQQLECVSEEEISTTLSEDNKATAENLQNSNAAEHNDQRQEPYHNAPAFDDRPPKDQTSPTVTQSLHMTFSTTENTMYSHSLVPSLVSNARPARIIANEVIIPQPTLPEQILQTQGDEPAFLNDSTIVVSSPLEMVDSSLAEVTVASSVSGISSESLIMESDMTYFK